MQMKAKIKEDLQFDMIVSGAPYSQYTFWKKAFATVSVSNEMVGT